MIVALKPAAILWGFHERTLLRAARETDPVAHADLMAKVRQVEDVLRMIEGGPPRAVPSLYAMKPAGSC